MQERLIEIIVYLLTELQQDWNQKAKVNLTSALQLKGYTDVEIHLAFAWIFQHLQQPINDSSRRRSESGSDVEDYPDIEQLILSPDAYGYLLQMIQLGIIKDNEMDQFIERALAFGKDDISVDDLKSIVASIIFDLDNHTNFNGYSLFHNDVPLQ
jgi:uncharacterized protein Smg (DUF494 family)